MRSIPLRHGPALLVAFVLAGLLAGSAQAAQDAYLTDFEGDVVAIGRHVGAAGALSPIDGSPFGPKYGEAQGITVSPDAGRVYAVAGGHIHGFARAASGTLTPLPNSPYAKGEGDYGIVITPDARRVFAANEETESVTVSDVDPDGSLTEREPIELPADSAPTGLAVTDDGRFLYVADRGNDTLHGFAIGGGVVAPLPGSPYGSIDVPFALSVAPDGRHLYAAQAGNPSGVFRFAIGADGSLTQQGDRTPTEDGSFGMTITPDGRFLYTADYDDSAISMFSIDGAGALTKLAGSPKASPGSVAALTTNGAGTRLFASSYDGGAKVYEIGQDGALTEHADSPFPIGYESDFQSIALTPAQPPVASFDARAAGLQVAVDAGASKDADGKVARYRWDFGDGTVVEDGSATREHAYPSGGTYTVTLTAIDDDGCSTEYAAVGQTALCNGSPAARTSRTVTVTDPPAPDGTTPPAPKPSGGQRGAVDSRAAFRAALLSSTATARCLSGACLRGGTRGSAYRVAVSGTYRGTPCAGRMRLTFRAPSSRTVTRTVALRKRSGRCRFSVRLRLRVAARTKLPARLRIAQRFLGTGTVKPGDASAVTVRLRRSAS